MTNNIITTCRILFMVRFFEIYEMLYCFKNLIVLAGKGLLLWPFSVIQVIVKPVLNNPALSTPCIKRPPFITPTANQYDYIEPVLSSSLS